MDQLRVLAVAAMLAAQSAAEEPAPRPQAPLALDAARTARWQPPAHLAPAEGFTVSVAAAAPLVEHPIMAGFDDAGRLYLAESAGRNLDEKQLQAETPNYIRRLEDTDGDGRFDRSTIFADKLTFPMGALWHRGALYVASPPYIWKLVDADDDGIAESREAIVGRFGFIGNAADIHGCFLSPTGRIYWCDGRHGHEFADEEGRVFSRGKAARIFSCRPDGSRIEVFCGGGMDNPVEVAFLPNGDVFGTMTFYNPDDARHDALVHYQYGGVYPRKHEVVAEFKRTGDFLPPLALYDTVAPSGLAVYDSDAWGPDYEHNLLSVHFNTHRLLRHRLTRSGASYTARDEPLLVSDHVDFHPTDVLVDADGSVLVLDTGGWFRHGCPTSQVAKPEVLGAIYRLTRKDSAAIDDPRGLRIDWRRASSREIAQRLGDRRPAVRQRAIEELARRDDEAIAALSPGGGFPNPVVAVEDSGRTTLALQNAVWTLARIATPSALNALRSSLDDPTPEVRQAAAHALGELRDPWAAPRMIELLADPAAGVRREAAVALGRLRHEQAVGPLLALAGRADTDRFLDHAAIYALIEITAPAATAQGLDDDRSQVRRAALVALDQMDGGPLDRERVAALLDTTDPALESAALEIIHRRGWSRELLEAFESWRTTALPDARRNVLRATLASLGDEPQAVEWIGKSLAPVDTDATVRRAIYESLAERDSVDWPAEWFDAATRDAAGGDEPLALAALRSLHGRAKGRAAQALARIAEDEGRTSVGRAAALALAASGASLAPMAFETLQEALADDDTLARQAAAAALAQAQLEDAQRERLLPNLASAGPLEASSLLAIYREASSDALRRRAVDAAEAAPGRASLSKDAIDESTKSWPESLREEARRRLAESRPAAALADQLARLEAATARGDAALGQSVFLGAKGACSACHRVGASGGAVGPELTRIAEIRSRRDLLESLVAPSLALARGYESVSVTTREGHVYTGLIVRQTPEAVWLVSADRSERRIPRAAIESLEPSALSIMPQGFDEALTAEELAGLLEYLQTLR